MGGVSALIGCPVSRTLQGEILRERNENFASQVKSLSIDIMACRCPVFIRVSSVFLSLPLTLSKGAARICPLVGSYYCNGPGRVAAADVDSLHLRFAAHWRSGIFFFYIDDVCILTAGQNI
jgi:hypothetical protein